MLAPLAGEAHKGSVARNLFLEASETHLVVLAHLSVRGGQRRRALVTLADANKDGRLDAEERRGLRDQLAAQALSGLSLSVDGRQARLQDAQAKLKLPDERPIEVAVHGELPLPAAAKQVVLRTTADLGALELRLLPGHRRLETSRARPGAEGLMVVKVGPGDEVVLSIRPAARPEP